MTAPKTPPFSLAHPLSVLLGKPPAAFQRRDLVRIIETRGIERITFHYTGLDGKLKELKIPVTDRNQAESVLAEGERVDGSSLFKGMVDASLSDLYVVPSFKTAFLNPFDDRSLDIICRYMTKDGEPAPFAPDNILARAYELFKRKTGMELLALGELEFYLLSDHFSGLYPAQPQQGYHAAAPFIKSGEILNEMLSRIAQMTGAVKYAHSEVGYLDAVQSAVDELRGKRAEQLEIEFLPRPIDEMADDVVLGRWLIRNIAFRAGCLATFTPKIEEGIAGNGMHFHLELKSEGKSVMTGPDSRLSPDARKLIGGLCRYADSLTAFGNTVASAYLRLVPHQEAPTRVCWSDLNRSALIRVPLGWSSVRNLSRRINPQETEEYTALGSRQTVEIRTPDGSANTHLLLAGIVLAADWAFGGDGDFEPGSSPLELADSLYVKGNIFEDKSLLSRLTALPASCVASSRLLLEKRAMYERGGIFPPSVVDYAARLLETEDDEFLAQTLAGLPEDERRMEMRRILHKDLHRH